MKKVLALVAATGILAAASLASATTIVNSKHDMNVYAGVAGTSTQICIYCHAPHNAIQSLPLWNRSNATQAFTLYSGLNMQNVSFKSGFTSDSTSLFCMSCHDGVTDISAVHNAGVIDGGAVQTGGNHLVVSGKFMSGKVTNSTSVAGKLGTDLSKTHPINFPVSTTDGQNDLNVDTTLSGSASAMGPGVAFAGMTKTFPLFKTTDTNSLRTTTNRSLECGSCHAVHNAEFSPFLRDTMAKSQLCLGCHNK